MPRFSEIYHSLQEATIPTAGPVPASLTVGFYFRLLEPAEFVGFRHYLPAGERGFLIGTLWDGNATDVVAKGITSLKQTLDPTPAAGWRNYYAHPRVQLEALHFYLLGVTTDGNSIFRTPDVFATADVNNGIISAPQFVPGTSNFNGVFLDPGSFNNPPTNSSGHLYGVDILLLIP